MRKWLIGLLALVLLCGCNTSTTGKESAEMSLYNDIVEDLASRTSFDEATDFQLAVTFTEISERYHYVVTLTNTTITMKDVRMLTWSEYIDDDYHPSLGIFEDPSYSLRPDYVDKDKGWYKGIALSGIVSEKSTVRVYLSYTDDDDQSVTCHYEVKA